MKRKFSLESPDWPFIGFDHFVTLIHEFLSENFLDTYSMKQPLLCKKPNILSHSHFTHWKNPAPRNEKQQNHSSSFQLFTHSNHLGSFEKNSGSWASPRPIKTEFLREGAWALVIFKYFLSPMWAFSASSTPTPQVRKSVHCIMKVMAKNINVLKFFLLKGLIGKFIWLLLIVCCIKLSKLCHQNFLVPKVIPKGNSRWLTSLRKIQKPVSGYGRTKILLVS